MAFFVGVSCYSFQKCVCFVCGLIDCIGVLSTIVLGVFFCISVYFDVHVCYVWWINEILCSGGVSERDEVSNIRVVGGVCVCCAVYLLVFGVSLQ